MCPLAQRTDNAGSFPSRWMAAHIFSLFSDMLKPRNLMKSFHVNLEVSFQLEVVNQGWVSIWASMTINLLFFPPHSPLPATGCHFSKCHGLFSPSDRLSFIYWLGAAWLYSSSVFIRDFAVLNCFTNTVCNTMRTSWRFRPWYSLNIGDAVINVLREYSTIY